MNETQASQLPVYAGNDLGAVWRSSATAFRLWAPTACSAALHRFATGTDAEPEAADLGTLAMQRSEGGTWYLELAGDLAGQYYQYELQFPDGTSTVTADPYAHAAGAGGTRSMVLNQAAAVPDGWQKDERPAIPAHARSVWEVHVADFTADPASGVPQAYRGKFMGFTVDGTTLNGDGVHPTGLNYLKRLGVTHVQLQPIFDFATVDEVSGEDYNWGYDPQNYNVPDGSYATDPYKPDVRIREFKQMVQALHKAGIRVVLDVVYNHTFNTAESNFERTVPGYFYRQAPDGGFADASACGNETASDRPMMRKYMVESVLHWINEYHIDGFRFDLMGIHDIETMNEIRKAATAVDPTIFIYGEGWAASAPQLAQDSLAMKANTYKMPGIAAFSDEMRDALRGPFNDNRQGAFLAGLPGGEESIKFGIVGAVRHPQVDNGKVNYSKAPWAEQPTQMISYVSCHDDMCLVDRLKSSIPGITPEELARLDKLAQTAVFTSQGVPFIYAGEEVMRDKKGVHNSYQSPDSVNAIDWKRKTEHADVFAYYKGLIQLRKNHPAFRLGDAGLVREHLEFLSVEGSNVVAYRLKGHAGGDTWGNIYVVLNARKETAKVSVPEGKYTVVCKDGFISEQGLGTMYGPEISVPAQSAMIFYQ